MKIEIEYNGAYATCSITDTFGKNPDVTVQFTYADKMSQIFALDAFRCIKEHWEREQKIGQLAPKSVRVQLKQNENNYERYKISR